MDPVPADLFEAAVGLFNRREYFDCQELFEQTWHASGEDDRPFVRALLQLAVALHLHMNRGGGTGTHNLLRQSLLVLDEHRPAHLGVDVQALFDEVTVYLEDLKASKARGPRLTERFRVPKIRRKAEG